MPKQGQQKATPARRAEFIEYLRNVGPGVFCINWKWSQVRGEYVRIFVDGEKVSAHRWVYEQINGPIPRDEHQRGPDDQVVMHTCDNKACVRPSHLRLGTQRDNIRDAVAKGRMVAPKIVDGRRKLSDFDVANIRMLKAQGAVQHHIAVAYGVSDARISHIVNNSNHRPAREA